MENEGQGHNIVRVDSLQNLVVQLNQPEVKVPPFIYVTTWPRPERLSVETYIRMSALPQEVQEQVREHVSGAVIVSPEGIEPST